MMKSRLILTTLVVVALGLAACGGTSKASPSTSEATTTTSTLPAGRCSMVPQEVLSEIVAGVKPQFPGYVTTALVVPVPASERLRPDWPQNIVGITYQEQAVGPVRMTFAINTLDQPLPIVPVDQTASFATMWGYQHGLTTPEGKWAFAASFQSQAYSILERCF